MQLDEHPSLLTVLPSSQFSEAVRSESPHTSGFKNAMFSEISAITIAILTMLNKKACVLGRCYLVLE